LKNPYVIHRAPLGTHERFIAFLLEHYGGAFPTWLAPVQVRIVPVSDLVNDYARTVEAALRNQLVRVVLDNSSETISKRVRKAITLKTPLILVLGKRESEDQTVTVRRYGSEKQETMGVEAFVAMILDEIATRRHFTAE
jgi:threonyl-tRNA synthetase